MIKRPTILTIAGHDPTGGAGIHADIETINNLGGHCCSIITALTVQNSENLYGFEPVSAELMCRQFHYLVKDFEINAIKIGLIGNASLVGTIVELLNKVPDIPVILDPILSAGGGTSVSNNDFIDKLKNQLLPHIDLITPNIPEAQKLANAETPDECATKLLEQGCKNVLITGTHEDDDKNVIHRLYSHNSEKLELKCSRLPHEYHGSGCTLSSSISYFLASKHSLTNSVKLAQEYTFNALQSADKPGHGQYFPIRNQHHHDDD